MADQGDISRSLGRVEGILQELTKSVSEDRESATEWRRSVYRLLQDHTDQIGELRTDVGIGAEISKQAREHVKAVEARLDDDIAPTIAEWRKIKNMGIGMAALIGLGGATIASAIWVFATYFWDAFSAAIRGALRIP